MKDKSSTYRLNDGGQLYFLCATAELKWEEMGAGM